MLRKRGLTVSLAEDGLKAVQAIMTNDHDVVLMDIQMPGMDGYDATRAVRQWELATGRPRLPIIALTAHALPGDRQKCLAAGMDDYLVKPYSAEAVSTVIARWLMPPGSEVTRTPPEAEPPAEAEVIDMARYEQVRSIMGTATGGLLDKVLETLDSEIIQLREAVAAGQAGAVRELLHRLKNTAGDVGAMKLHALAAQFERDIEQEIEQDNTRENESMPTPTPTHLPDISRLEQACAAALSAVRRLRQALDQP